MHGISRVGRVDYNGSKPSATPSLSSGQPWDRRRLLLTFRHHESVCSILEGLCFTTLLPMLGIIIPSDHSKPPILPILVSRCCVTLQSSEVGLCWHPMGTLRASIRCSLRGCASRRQR